MPISIRLVDSLEAVEHFRVLEHLIWGEPLDATIPAHVIVTTLHNGGGLLAAYAEDGPAETGGMVGLTYWWPGLATPTTTPDGKIKKAASLRLKMCSHLAGVLPAWRGTGLGLRLKLAQRDAILEQGMTGWVTWTYDPLLRTNAVFNLHRLGAICNTYHVNLYGELPDELNAGIPSDRCQVDWWLAGARVQECSRERAHGESRHAYASLPPEMQVLSAGSDGRGFLTPPPAHPVLDGGPVALPLPEDIYAIRSVDHVLGAAWRQWMREALESTFAAGYLLTDCVRHHDDQWRYVLTAS